MGAKMAKAFDRGDLEADEFAFYFSSELGIEARELGQFLQRSATVARREGAELRVITIREGSLAVVLKTLPKRVGRAVGREFSETPVQTTAASVGLAAAVVGAIIWSMSPKAGDVSPMAKAGAELVDKEHCTKIELVTHDRITVIMDGEKAAEVRRLERLQKSHDALGDMLEAPQRIKQLVDHARRGKLSGATAIFGDELHFRPDGYRFWVPVDMQGSEAWKHLFPGAHFEISGEIRLHAGQPDSIVIHHARQV
jgi:hypothetical protein